MFMLEQEKYQNDMIESKQRLTISNSRWASPLGAWSCVPTTFAPKMGHPLIGFATEPSKTRQEQTKPSKSKQKQELSLN